ncbi:hypothetical protein C8F01DRAFT_1253582 [Mycena amicta]|nr:hypothetical protein C8F01DRAFT_1253582 [Mycena amicta]
MASCKAEEMTPLLDSYVEDPNFDPVSLRASNAMAAIHARLDALAAIDGIKTRLDSIEGRISRLESPVSYAFKNQFSVVDLSYPGPDVQQLWDSEL